MIAEPLFSLSQVVLTTMRVFRICEADRRRETTVLRVLHGVQNVDAITNDDEAGD